MKKIINRERIIALICFAFAAYIWVTAGTFPASILDSVGPAKYPRFLAAIIGIISILMFITANGPSEPIKGKRDFFSLGYLIVVIIAYLLLFPVIGFILGTTLFLLALTLKFDKRELKVKLKVAIPYSIGFSLLLYFFFAKLMGVLLPTLIL